MVIRFLAAILRALRGVYDRNQAGYGFREVAGGETTTTGDGPYFAILAIGGAVVLSSSGTVARRGDDIAADRTITDGSIVYGNWDTIEIASSGTVGVAWCYRSGPNESIIGSLQGGN